MAFFEQMMLEDSGTNLINPATNESLILLRRMVKLMETLAVVDSATRQRVTIDAANTTTVPAFNVTTVGTITTLTNPLAAGTNTIGDVTVGKRGEDQWIDIARNMYSNSIRNRLTFN